MACVSCSRAVSLLAWELMLYLGQDVDERVEGAMRESLIASGLVLILFVLVLDGSVRGRCEAS